MNKKALSQVVTTVIFVSLALIAIGIVWAVINNVIQQGAESAEGQAACLGVSFEINSADCSTTPGTCAVSVTRGAGGGTIDGARAIITDGTNNAQANSAAVVELGQTTINVPTAGLGTVIKVTVAGVVGDTLCPVIVETDTIV